MDGAYVGKNAVIGGVFDTQFSTDGGNSFNVTKGDKIVGQNCETIPSRTDNQFFGITGADIRGGNGVAISKDAGKSVSFVNISIAQTLTRYGAFPSRTTWYISAGTFPTTEAAPGKKILHRVSSRLHYEMDLRTGRRALKLRRTSATPKPKADIPDWSGEILKTTDAGKTWVSQFWTTDFYFNGIDCLDETHCCAVGEADQGKAPGSRVLCTMDGKTWNQTYFASGASYSLLGMRAVPGSNGEYWAGGGNLPSQFQITGQFPHSLDGGKTWTVEELKKVYVTDLTVVDGTHAWGSTIDEDEQSGLVIYE
jgi:hypothetical protein